MEAYLDNAATTKCLEEVKEIVVQTMITDYANPSAKYVKGLVAEEYIKAAKNKIAKTLKVNQKEVYFTSGGTESNNLAIIGTAMANKRAGKHIITTSIEHSAVVQPMAYLEEQGFRITYLPVNKNGLVAVTDLKAALCEDTILISIMYVNNEIGTVEPIVEMGTFLKREYPNVLFHVDAIQAYGKYRIFPKREGIDLLSVSGHKIHGPKGVGFLYIDEQVKIQPILWGGGQQKGIRSGTENVSGIAGLGVAAETAYKELEEQVKHLKSCRTHFSIRLAGLDDIVINGKEECTTPNIISVSFKGVRSEVLLHALEEKGISVSSGSACSTNKKIPISSVLKEVGITPDLLESTLRFSFSRYTTIEELDYCIEVLKELLPILRKYARH